MLWIHLWQIGGEETHNKDLFINIAEKELPRFAEFSIYAIKGISCRLEIREILQRYSIEHLMDNLSWEVYKENKERKVDELWGLIEN